VRLVGLGERAHVRSESFPDWKGSRVVEPRPLGFRGGEQAQAAHAALLYPVAQNVGRIVFQRVQDAHTGEVLGILGSAIRGITVVIFVCAVGLNQDGLVDSGLGVEGKQHFGGHVPNPLAGRSRSHLSGVFPLVLRDGVDVGINDHGSSLLFHFAFVMCGD
jgi:hypothetical protein